MNRPEVGKIPCDYCGGIDCNYDCDESQANGFTATESDMIRETVYRERSGGKWTFWTYSDEYRVYISYSTAKHLIKQGGRLVSC